MTGLFSSVAKTIVRIEMTIAKMKQLAKTHLLVTAGCGFVIGPHAFLCKKNSGSQSAIAFLSMKLKVNQCFPV